MAAIKAPGVTTIIGKVLPSVLIPRGQAGQAWPSDLQAPVADGTNVSVPPMFDGFGPALEVAGVDTPKLGIGTADPVFHGGG